MVRLTRSFSRLNPEGLVKVIDRRRFDVEGNARSPLGEPEPAGPPVAKPDDGEVDRLRGELEAAHKRVDELARAFQAVDRDREDFKVRLNRERERLLDVDRGQVVQGLLEAVDELDLCLTAAADDESPLAQGVRLIREKLVRRVESTGVERLSLTGQPYDPGVAEASDVEATPNPDDDQKVVAELRAGYRLKGAVIRPARVRVARYVKPAHA